MRTARKLSGLSQVETCKILGISQGYLSKVESGQNEPDVSVWFALCSLANIPADTWITGYIDQPTPALLRSSGLEHGFKVPAAYSQNRGSKVRSLIPFIRHAANTLGEAKLLGFLKTKGIDSDFFNIYDSQIGFEFCSDLVKLITENHVLKASDFQDMGNLIKTPVAHGVLHKQYDKKSSTADLLRARIKNSKYYGCDFDYEIEEESSKFIDVSVKPGDHLTETSYTTSPEVRAFFDRYDRESMEQFLHYQGKFSGTISQVSQGSTGKGFKKCIYRIQAA